MTEESTLIVLTGSLGDVVRGLPVVSALKADAKFNRQITWVIDSKWRDVVTLHPSVSDIIEYDRRSGVKGWFSVVKKLRRKRFDTVLDLQRVFRSGFFSWLSGAPTRIGFHKRDSKEFNWIFQTKRAQFLGDEISKQDHYFALLEPLGLSRPSKLDYGLHGVTLEAKAPRFLNLSAKPFIACVLGSSWESKDWFSDGYFELIKIALQGSAYDVVLVGDRSKMAMAAKLTAAIESPRVKSVVGETTLSELIGILSGSTIGIGPDSGPGHLMSALGKPFVSLFGATLPSRTAPWGNEELVVQSLVGCSPCYRRVCPGLGRVCMKLISPNEVWKKIEQGLQNRLTAL